MNQTNSLRRAEHEHPKKSTQSAGTKHEAVENFIPLYTKNVERLADMQKKSLQIASEQNAEFIDTCKKAFHFYAGDPGIVSIRPARRGLQSDVDTQKGAIELAVRTKPRPGRLGAGAGRISPRKWQKA